MLRTNRILVFIITLSLIILCFVAISTGGCVEATAGNGYGVRVVGREGMCG